MRKTTLVVYVMGAATAALLAFQAHSQFPDNTVGATTVTTVAANPTRGPYTISSGLNGNTAWRIDQGTGLVSFCQYLTNSTDPALLKSRAPVCSAWGE